MAEASLENKKTSRAALTSLGLTGVTVSETISASFITGLFLIYLTDYAGLGLLGATIAPIILVVGRVMDFILDPLIGLTIDKAGSCRFGKYRLFILLSILVGSLSVLLLFSIPDFLRTRQSLLLIWVLAFYLLYSAASSFFTVMPLIQSIMPDTARRARLATYQRMLAVCLGILFSFFMMLVNQLNESMQNLSRSFSILASVFIGVAMAISLASLLLVHEGSDRKTGRPKVRLGDVLDIFRKNKAFTVNFTSQVFRGLVFTLMTATATYYCKWAYAADLSTGQFDAARLGQIMVINGMAVLAPMLFATSVSPWLISRMGSCIRVINLSNGITAVGGLAMFILQIAGILQQSYILFTIGMAVMIFGAGLNAVPSQTIGLECIDYNVFKTGKSMAGMIHVLGRLLGKAQQALSTLAVGLLLASIGYNVDSVTGSYQGDLAAIPGMLSSFILISSLLPAVFSLISSWINRYYPIDDPIRHEMARAALETDHDQ